MPNNKWVWIAIGIAVGMFVVPIAMGYIGGIGGATVARSGV